MARGARNPRVVRGRFRCSVAGRADRAAVDRTVGSRRRIRGSWDGTAAGCGVAYGGSHREATLLPTSSAAPTRLVRPPCIFHVMQSPSPCWSVARRSRQPCPSIRLASGQDTDVFGRRYLVEELVPRRLPDSRRWDTGVEGGRIGSTRTPRTVPQRRESGNRRGTCSLHLYRRRPADPLAGRRRREGPTRVYSLGPGRNRAEAVPDGR
jgi:hypothetical protein